MHHHRRLSSQSRASRRHIVKWWSFNEKNIFMFFCSFSACNNRASGDEHQLIFHPWSFPRCCTVYNLIFSLELPATLESQTSEILSDDIALICGAFVLLINFKVKFFSLFVFVVSFVDFQIFHLEEISANCDFVTVIVPVSVAAILHNNLRFKKHMARSHRLYTFKINNVLRRIMFRSHKRTAMCAK